MIIVIQIHVAQMLIAMMEFVNVEIITSVIPILAADQNVLTVRNAQNL